ncbi:hypothetical protein ACH95_00190 [Bacillus glycinifermentans]|uniref:Uncharacterized protein n=1 Tax=Bacillus glycinifermentans TaxID=1664069 RepID=A0A0J6F3J8_9BACI|nr:hypothetical protein [Bacillus glycinifermentans]ATH94923.1 hypothetical protein COP00_22060 [Bacillus glycinifermentans]KMM63544.1 hypothetical protein ACH95_00190 [Bacillus glycinifermentans]KRT93113.1 hypothetical protein AB447_219360 [Bacillus glycinifermentans]MEC0487722.1 hypothetical protein [Bacillus glycinifermentans]MEC0493839.1 hypothetical protein [Bacillus glycinifermentans]
MIKTILTFLLSLSILTVSFIVQDEITGFDPEASSHTSLNSSNPETHVLKPPPLAKSFLNQTGKNANIFSSAHAESVTRFIPQLEVRHGDFLLEKTCAIPVKYQSNYLS